MDDSNAFRLERDKKVSFFDCHRRFLPLNHSFRSDRRSFLKGKTIRKGPPKLSEVVLPTCNVSLHHFSFLILLHQ
jgi:hypothetical protein